MPFSDVVPGSRQSSRQKRSVGYKPGDRRKKMRRRTEILDDAMTSEGARTKAVPSASIHEAPKLPTCIEGFRVGNLCSYDVSEKMNTMYSLIWMFSDSAFNLDKNRPPLLSEYGVSQLEPFPMLLNALYQLLGVSTMGDVRSKTRKLSLEKISNRLVVRAVTSMIVCNVIFEKNPFAGDCERARRILQNHPLYNTQNADIMLQWYHTRVLSEDESFKAKLHDEANAAGELMWNTLKPLVTLGLTELTPSVIECCQTSCSNIANLAYLLNTEIKAKRFQPQIFWPISGTSFDDDCFESFIGSSLQSVLLALSFGIKKDHPSGPPTVYEKSKVYGESGSIVTDGLKVDERASLAVKLNTDLTPGQDSTWAGTGSDVANPITISDDDE